MEELILKIAHDVWDSLTPAERAELEEHDFLFADFLAELRLEYI